MRDVSSWQSFLTVYGVVFVAELGDKTQLATMAFTAEHRRAIVFAASASALVASAGVAVLLGGWLSTLIDRLCHRVEVVPIDGESYRKTEADAAAREKKTARKKKAPKRTS